METSVLPSAKSRCLAAMAAVLLLLLASLSAQANMKAAYGLSPFVYDVKGMGQWSMGSKSGQVRLVITRDKKRDEVYLQWVAWDEGEPVHVESTIAVTEINRDDRYSITFIRRSPNCVRTGRSKNKRCASCVYSGEGDGVVPLPDQTLGPLNECG